MTTPHLFSSSLGSRLLAGAGTLALVAAVGLFASSRPAHTAGGPVPVAVSNTVQTLDTESPSRQPFQTLSQVNFSGLLGNHTFLTVPAGKRLVVESLTAYDAGFVADQNSFDLTLSGDNGFIGMTLLPGTDRVPIKTQMGRLTLEAGQQLVMSVASNAVVSDSRLYVSISGYYVDVP